MNRNDRYKRLELCLSVHGRKLFSYVAKRMPTADAEDIVQEVCLKFLTNEKTAPQNIPAWIFKAAKNLIIDRSRKKREELLEDRSVPYNALDERADILKKLNIKELRERIRKAIASLPEDQKFVFIETEINGKSIKEISQETGINPNTLLSRKHKAVLALREKLA